MAQNKYVLVNSVEGIPDKLIQQSMAETIKGYSKPTLSRAVLAPTFIASKPRYLGIFDGKWNLAYMIYQRHGRSINVLFLHSSLPPVERKKFIQLTGTTPARYLREELIRQGVRKTGTTTFLPLGKKHVQKLVEDGLLRKRLFPNKFKVTKDWVRLARGKTGLLPKG